MKTLTFTIQKGGTGKTSISTSIAYELAKQGKTILLIDADPQSNATSWLGIDELNIELADVLKAEYTKQQINIKDAIIKTKVDNLYLLGSAGIGGELSSVKDMLAVKSPYIFSNILEPIKADFDFCIIDTSPSYTAFETQIYIASNELIPVLQLDNFSLEGLSFFASNILQLIKDYRLNPAPVLDKIILNKLNRARVIDKQVLQAFQNTQYQSFIIPTEPAFSKAQMTKTFIQDFPDTKKETIEAIKNITHSIIEGSLW